MKKLALTIMILAVAGIAFSQQLASITKPANALSPGTAAFNWVETTHDFGQIKQGTPVSHEFTFTNTGDIPLIVTSVSTSCGCTVSEYTKTPIPPGEKGIVKATYNAAKAGVFSKTITVNANTEDTLVQLTIKGEVAEVVQ